MESVNPELIKKYFCKECTPEETEQVLAWFRTPEGMEFLEEHIDRYNYTVRNANNLDSNLFESVDSEKIFSGIQTRILETSKKPELEKSIVRRKNRRGLFLKVAAALLIMVFAAANYLWLEQRSSIQQSGESVTMVYTTEEEQHKLLTLIDGTSVRLNENSSLAIPEDYNRGTRKVELTGEAYFEVKHNPELPFKVTADEGLIHVLGTKFNVKVSHAHHVQVAVLEGKVALSGEHEHEGSSAILTKGYFGVYNFDSRETTIEQTSVENYTSWISGSLEFEDTPLWSISRQLQWLYGVSFSYSDDELKDLRLYASFQKDELIEVLNIIASTLEIDYIFNGEEVIWKKNTDL